MRKPLLLTLLTLALSLPVLADDDRHQSYISYDDGGTVVRTGEDNREIDAHRNLPIYPGDEVTTARRGRAEVRLSDGNIIGIDRTTSILFRSMRDAYDGDSDETVAELKYGKVAVHRTDLGRDHVRLDTANASYVAEREAIYSVETTSNGGDRVTVFEGNVELRTRSRTTRLRSGAKFPVDESGLYDLVGDQRAASDDFERWFLRRAERFENYNSRYVDRRLGYWADDLDDYGRWVFVTGIGWSWRPYVAVGWRPYHHGYWGYRHGCLTWVSYDPWAWGTYHYGRWSFDPGFGWVWVPGYGYSPAWVYWSYGPSWVGWAPAGWWDCYRPYYNWAYHPYRNRGITSFNFGFYGRVRVSEFDLRPWTFVDNAGVLISNRADRAALTTEAIKQRLARSKDGFATIAGGAARFTREELRDPAEAVRRRGLDGRYTGRETGAPPTDMTPFLRRDGEISGTIRDRIVRSRGGSSAPSDAPRAIGGGSSTVPSTGTIDRRAGGGGGVVGRGGSSTPAERPRAVGGGGVDRGNTERGNVDRGNADRVERDRRDRGDTTNRGSGDWRSRVGDRGSSTPPTTSAPSNDNGSRSGGNRDDSWRSRVRSGERGGDSSSSNDRSTGSNDVPRRVIDGIGGARVVPRDRGDQGSSSGDRGAVRDSGSSSGSRDRGSARDSGGSRERSGDRGGSRESVRPSQPRSESGGGRSSAGSSNSGGSSRSSGGSSTSGSSGGGGRSSGGNSGGGGGGRVKRDG